MQGEDDSAGDNDAIGSMALDEGESEVDLESLLSQVMTIAQQSYNLRPTICCICRSCGCMDSSRQILNCGGTCCVDDDTRADRGAAHM